MIEAVWNCMMRAFWLPTVSFFIFILFPYVLDQVDSRGVASQGFSIAVDSGSMAMIALTDIREDFENEESIIDDEMAQVVLSHWGQVTLNAGMESHQVIDKIFLPNTPSSEILKPEKLDQGELTGMVISQSNGELPKIIAQEAPQTLESLSLKNIYGDWEPLNLRKQKLLAAANPETLKQPKVSDRAKDLVEQALKEKKEEQERRIIRSQTGSQIVISKATQTPTLQASKPLKRETTPVKKDRTIAAMEPTEWKDYHERPIVISGRLLFSDGLAFTGEQQLSISRVYEGKTQETAKIWIRDARFEIPIKRAKGYLIAEMHDPTGLQVAYQEFDLSQLPLVPANQYQLTDFDIKLEPVQQGAIVKVISGYSYEDKQLTVNNATVILEPFGSELSQDADGQFVERSLEVGSDIVVRVEVKDHWPTLSRVTSGTVATVRAFHNSMMTALINIMSLDENERKANLEKGIIWGIVTDKGRPVSGARVEISGLVGSLSYINKVYLPDVGLEQSSDNGMFAVVGAEEGLQSVRVTYEGVQYPAQVIKTLPGHVTFVELNFDKMQSVRLKVIDAFDENAPLNVSIRSLGSDVLIENVVSSQDIQSQKHPLSFHLLEADAGLDYEMIRVEEPLSEHFIRFPLVQRDWLRGIQAKLKINRTSEPGIIVGWVKDQGFDVFLNDGKKLENLRYVFFNKLGQIVEKDQSPSGFIIFNVPVGQQTVTIVPRSRKMVMTKVLTVDTDFVSTWIR